MAPPSTRRRGFSRRAQYGLFLGYVIALAGVLFSALLLLIAVVDPTGFNALKGAALDLTHPISAAGRSVADFFEGIGTSTRNYMNAGAQNGELKRQLAASRRKLIEGRAAELENRRLKGLLKLSTDVEDEVAVTRIVGSSFISPRRLATLPVGTSSGVKPGQPVRAAEGLLGRILETGRWSSRVLLISDGASNVPVRLLRDGTPAIAVGHGDGSIDLKTLEVGKNPFRRGDVLLTSGVGGVYPPNIPVAVVVAVQGERTLARPLADPGSVDFAVVLNIYEPLADAPLSERSEEALRGAGQ